MTEAILLCCCVSIVIGHQCITTIYYEEETDSDLCKHLWTFSKLEIKKEIHTHCSRTSNPDVLYIKYWGCDWDKVLFIFIFWHHSNCCNFCYASLLQAKRRICMLKRTMTSICQPWRIQVWCLWRKKPKVLLLMSLLVLKEVQEQWSYWVR